MSHSGNLVLRLPKSIHAQASRIAKDDGVSLNHWLSNAVAMAVAKSECGQESVPTTRLEAIAMDDFCDFNTCSSHEPNVVGMCAACDAIYAARECLMLRKEKYVEPK